MTAVEDYIYQYEGDQREVMLYFHHLLINEFNLMPRMQYNLPFYYGKSWICYLFPSSKGLVELAFPRGNELSNVQGLLESKGRKMVSSVGFCKVQDIPVILLREIIHEAVLLDTALPYTFNKGRNR